MLYGFAADAVLVFHLAFVLFVALGGLFVWRWPRVAWAHLPAAIWGAAVELTSVICPLTPLEKALRQSAGRAAYEGGFIAHYIVPVLYPAGLTRPVQVALGAFVILLNVGIYWRWWRDRRNREKTA
jgi:hypothetical protein